MPARQSAGDMIRSVSYAANSVGGAAFQLSYTALWTSQFTVFGEEFSDDSRKTPLTLDVPLASASRYHTIDMQRILRAFTRQTKMREPQRQLATSIHPCWRSLTILTPVIPRPRQGSTGRRAAAEAPGRNGGLQRGTLKAELLSSVCALDPNDSPTVIVPGDLRASALERGDSPTVPCRETYWQLCSLLGTPQPRLSMSWLLPLHRHTHRCNNR